MTVQWDSIRDCISIGKHPVDSSLIFQLIGESTLNDVLLNALSLLMKLFLQSRWFSKSKLSDFEKN